MSKATEQEIFRFVEEFIRGIQNEASHTEADRLQSEAAAFATKSTGLLTKAGKAEAGELESLMKGADEAALQGAGLLFHACAHRAGVHFHQHSGVKKALEKSPAYQAVFNQTLEAARAWCEKQGGELPVLPSATAPAPVPAPTPTTTQPS